MAKLILYDQAKEFYGKLTNKQKIIIASSIIIIFATLFILILISSGKSTKSVLFSDLNDKDAAKIVEKLKEKNIDYELTDDGKTILVNEKDKYDLRLSLASEGLPENSIVGYELFDQTNLGMSEFVQKLNYRRALEGELTKTIQAIPDISKARVHIVIPEKALFEKDQKKPTASIVLTMKSNQSIGRINVEGIQNLVASSIEGMSPNDVTIVDTRGRILSHHTDEDQSLASITAKQHEQTQQVEDYYRRKIQSMLDGVLGVGNSEARVTAELNFRQIEETITKYDESEPVLLSTQVVEDVANNATTAPDSNLALEMSKGQKNTIENYEVPKTVQKIIEEVGNIERLSVAVAINGKDSVIEVQGEPKIINVPLPKQQEEQLRKIVRNALGYDPRRDDNIEVYYYPFTPYNKDEILKDYYQKKWWKTRWWEDRENLRIITLILAIIITLIALLSILKSKFIKERIRIALSLPEAVKIEEEEPEKEVPEEELEEIMIDDEDLLLIPPELPDQLLLEGDKEAQEFKESIEEEEEFDKESLATRAKASVSGEIEEMSEDTMMKLELKNKIENFVSENPEEAVKLVRFFIAQDIEKNPFNF